MLGRFIPSLLAVAVLATLAGVALLVTELTTDLDIPVRPAAGGEPPVRGVDSGLLTSNRSVLSLCIDGIEGAAVSAAFVDTVRQALAELRQELSDRGYHQNTLERLANAVLPLGCPRAAALDGEPYFSESMGRPSVRRGRTVYAPDAPSPHRVHIYLVPESRYLDWFGDFPYVHAGEEYFCVGHDCAGVTSGVYFTPSASPEVVYQALRDALGFVDPFEGLYERVGLPTPTPRPTLVPNP